MTSSTNDCKWKRHKNKHIGEYFTCDTNDNIYKTIHLAKYPKKGCAFDKEKIKQYKDVLGKKEDMKDVQNLTNNLKKLHIQLYDGKKDGSVVVKKGFKIISKGKTGWKPIVPITSLKQRGGKVVQWKIPLHDQPPQKVHDDLKISPEKCKAAPAIQSCTIDPNIEYVNHCEVNGQIYKCINLLENPSCDSHSCEIEKYFSIGKFPEGFESFDSYLAEPSHSDVQSSGGTTTLSTEKCTTDKPFLFFSNTKAFINHTLWNDANDGDDKTRIVPHLENGKRKLGQNFVGNKDEMTKFNEVLKKLAPHQHNHLNILNIVTAPLQYILPPNEPSALSQGPRPWEKRIEVISRISESVVMLKQLFRKNNKSVVNIFNIHLYDPEVEMYNYMKINGGDTQSIQTVMNVIDPSTVFANESSLMQYFTKSVVDQIKVQNSVLRESNIPTQKFKSFEKMLLLCKEGQIVGPENKSLEEFIRHMDINMIYCAGGETHWLNRQMKENKLFETLNKSEFNRIVWSGFSAGVINAGTTTAMAAEKVFNMHANPKRLLRGVGAVDDITVIKSKDPNKKFCEVYNKIENNTIKLEYYQTPEDCDMTGANWFCNGVVFPHYNPLWMEMIIDVMSKGNSNPHFKDVDKLLIMADGECVHNLQSNDIVDRLPSGNLEKIEHAMTKEKIIFARNITNSLIDFVNTMSIRSPES